MFKLRLAINCLCSKKYWRNSESLQKLLDAFVSKVHNLHRV
ncbi:hypothetical protein BBUWI9123_Z0014 (plasmid) [Borreliella burgdorferi WI91-23]|nr:hypothetical protein BBU64B_G0014 [Borreliella burgdorferi 64b]ACN55114.1 hypothetical protein BBUWI9123_N0013 [Borreliella burgdorferi WI91-23]ACN55585.1 hypothetical protein BBUWI9123_Z0014 [Borreliella burgdorferi WI91-23]